VTKADEYRERFYREWTGHRDLRPFRIVAGETDLMIYASPHCPSPRFEQSARARLGAFRDQILQTIDRFPEFLTSLDPLPLQTPFEITNAMIRKSSLAGVGPMASVAGAIAEFVGKSLLSETEEIIVENGGDLFMRCFRERTVLIYAGEDSPFRDRLRLRIRGGNAPVGICSSSARIGHSLSLGNTDLALVRSPSAVTADAFATAVGNLVKKAEDIPAAIEFASACAEVEGGLITIGDRIGIWGFIELVQS
jgi:ApbE superfamily uncharacterized protein (UPF0280 family)